MIVTTDIQLFRILKERLGEKEAEALVDFVDAKLKENNAVNLTILATKEDIAETKQEISATRTLIAETKAELIKWMFIFWIGQIAATFGFILLFLKK
jgi:hypothetical protein